MTSRQPGRAIERQPAVDAQPSKKTRHKSVVEHDEFAAAIRRLMKAFGKRAGSDPEAFRMLVDLCRENRAVMAEAARELHTEYSYAEIAQRLGVKPQAVHQRWFADEPTTDHHRAAARGQFDLFDDEDDEDGRHVA